MCDGVGKEVHTNKQTKTMQLQFLLLVFWTRSVPVHWPLGAGG